MGIFEKIELEPIEDYSFHSPRSSRRWTDETLVIPCSGLKRLGSLFLAFCFFPVVAAIWEEGFFAFEVLIIFGGVASILYLADCLLTYEVVFTPESIVKKGYLGQTTLPTDVLVLRVDEQVIRFYHGTEKNFRESIKIYRCYIDAAEAEDILGYAEDVYQIDDRSGKAGSAEKPGLTAGEFLKAVSSYKMMSAFFAIFACIAVFTVGVQDSFFGVAPTFPAFAIRLVCIALAACGFFFLMRIVARRANNARTMSLEARLKQEDNTAFTCAVVACAMALGGLALFLLTGNLLDFYLFFFVGVLCYLDFYPRYSRWEQAVRGKAADYAAEDRVAMPQRRSFQVSLVLMGALAVASYGETTHYIYKSRQDCLDDWGDDSACREVRSGSGRYYGPRYGSSTGRPVKAVGVSSISRGGFGSMGSFHASFGG